MKEKLIKLPDKIFEILEQHKTNTGRPMSGMIQEAVYRWMIHERLIKIKTVSVSTQRKEQIQKK